MKLPAPKGYVTVKEAVELSGRLASSIRTAIARKHLLAIKQGGDRYLRPAALMEWAQSTNANRREVQK